MGWEIKRVASFTGFRAFERELNFLKGKANLIENLPCDIGFAYSELPFSPSTFRD